MRKIGNEQGAILVLSLLILLVVSVIGMAALGTTTYQATLSGNKRISEQAFYSSEAGINEFVGRFREGAGSEIKDTAPSDPNWRLYVSPDSTKAATVGYVSNQPQPSFCSKPPEHIGFCRGGET